MWLMLQQDTPEDLVIATGEAHSVREFLEEAFSHADLDWQEYIAIDPKYFRPTEVDYLLGDAGKARRILGWEPRVSFRGIGRLMVDADLQDLIDLRQCQDVIQRLRQGTASAPKARMACRVSRVIANANIFPLRLSHEPNPLPIPLCQRGELRGIPKKVPPLKKGD